MHLVRGPWSVRSRLTAAAVFVVVLLLSASAALLVWRVDSSLRASTDAAVRREAADLASTATAGQPPVIPATVGSSLVQVTDSSGRVVASSPAIDGEPLAFHVEVARRGALPVTSTVAVAALDGADYRVAAVNSRSSSYDVYVARPLAEVDQSTAELAATLALGIPLLVLVFAGLTWIFAGRALRPVELLRRQADEISLRDLHRRLIVPSTGDELQALGATLNELLARLDSSLSRQRQFVADAAHELRSPVAAIRSQAEVADHVNGAAEPSALSQEAVRLTTLVDDLLALARIDAQPQHRRDPVDFDDVVLNQVALVRHNTDIVLDATGISAARVRGDRHQLARAVRNILDNAVRHTEGLITVSLLTRDGRALLVVEDDGPGIPEPDRARVLERFTRLDDARTRSTGGVGLGLAIADEIVRLHSGRLSIEEGTVGARVVIEVPLDAMTD